jgi:pimeloyl-ACP methyl ester carboxylesterase
VADADATNLLHDCILIARRFGGMQALRTMAQHPDRFKGLILVDAGVRPPDDFKEHQPQLKPSSRPKVYSGRDIAIARLQVQPPQTRENQYLLDHIARTSVAHGAGLV